MKIGIISLYGNFNCGNKLQNYAVQSFFRNMGFDTVIIRNPIRYRFPLDGKAAGVNIKNYLRHIKNTVKGEKTVVYKNKSFYTFAKRYLTESEQIIDRYNVGRKMPECDYYVVGSDQVWNDDFAPIDDPLFSLGFAPYKKRLSFSASFGRDIIPENQKEVLSDTLSGIRLITVRENTGKEIVEDLTGRKAEVLMDPTLMFDSGFWEKAENPPSEKLPEKYVFVYHIGEFSDEQKKQTETHAKKIGAETVYFDRNIGPSEFLYLIHNAECVITDSFHACAFSVIYKKNFYVLTGKKREQMLNRITTLLSCLKITDRIVTDGVFNRLPPDYSSVDEILIKEREKAYSVFGKIFDEDKATVSYE